MKILKMASLLCRAYYFLVAAILAALLVMARFYAVPAGDGDRDVIFTVPQGSSFSQIAEKLELEHLLRSRYLIYLPAWLNMQMGSLRAGKYRLNTGMAPSEILDMLVQGRTVKVMLVIPEGYNIFQIARVVEKAGLDTKARFLATVRDAGFLKSMGLDYQSAEGFLFPDTYLFEDNAGSREIAAVMIRHFFSIWNRNRFAKRARELGTDMFSTIILASIVEKEAMRDEEKPVIASVFWNRIKKRMPLQADPTVQYGILVERRIYRKRLRTSDLRRITPYNTYRLKGLPEGPISNPGLVSINAVLYPAETDYLFFVSMNNGRHKFSRTLKEHNAAVRKYQLGKK